MSVLVAASGCAEDLTELVVVVETDLSVPDEIDRVVVVVDASAIGGQVHDREAPLTGDGAIALPVTLSLVHSGGPLGPVYVSAIARRASADIVSRRAELSFASGRTLALVLALERACAGESCGADETCARGVCRPVAVEPGETVPWPRAEDAARSPADDAGTSPADDAGAGACDPSVCSCSRDCSTAASECRCTAGCPCSFACGDECRASCSGAGARCTIDAYDISDLRLECNDGATCVVDAAQVSNAEDLRCETGATCDIDCGGASNCFTRCITGARCAIDCAGASNCRFTACEGGEMSCPGSVIVCNRACP